jgi:hypothetical protein
MAERNRLLVSPEDDFAYGQGISPEATWRNLIPFAEFGLGMAPVSGEAMAARDAWDASGRGGNALLQGDYGQAASEYLNMGTGLLGALPGAGIVARGTKRGAAWMDRNLPEGFNRLLDSVYPSDPRSTTNIFAGPTAKTADHQALAQAQEMKAQGASRADIWRETGWDLEKADQIPRFEIDDSKSLYDQNAYKELKESAEFDGRTYNPSFDNAQLDFVLDHDQLYAAYPDMGEMPLAFFPNQGAMRGEYGGLSHKSGMALRNDLDDATGRSTALHEAQHAVQGREGFPRGGSQTGPYQAGERDILIRQEFNRRKKGTINNPYLDSVPTDAQIMEEAKAFVDSPVGRELAYRRLAGEVEARNVQSRMNMTAAERRTTPPWETQDVSDDQQIVRFR